jgi:hypothetical protein
MLTRLVIGVLTVAISLISGLVGWIIQEQGKQQFILFNRYVLISGAIGIVFAVAIISWLESSSYAPLIWRWHAVWYLQKLREALAAEGRQTKFSRLDFAQRKADARHLLPTAEVVGSGFGVKEDMVRALLKSIDSGGEVCKALILGEPGSGKTTGIERLAFELTSIASRRLTFGKRIPVLIYLRKYKQGKLLEFVTETVENSAGRDGKKLAAVIEKLIEDDRIILLFDALDEALGESKEILLVELGELIEANTYKNLPVVITGRTREDPGAALPQLKTFEIQDLSDDAVRAFIRAYKKPEDDEEDIWRQLGQYGLLKEKSLGRNPFLLALIVKTSVFEGNKGEILNSIVDSLLRREWYEKPETERAWNRVLERDRQLRETKLAVAWLAYKMSLAKVITIEWGEAEKIVSEWIKSRDIKDWSAQDVLGLCQDAQLLKYNAEKKKIKKPDPVEFRHRLLQEFMTAWVLEEEKSLCTPELLEQFSQSSEYWETLLLLGGITEARAALIRAVLGDCLDNRRLLLSVGLLQHGEADDELKGSVLSALLKSLSGGATAEHKQAAVQLAALIGDAVANELGEFLNQTEVARDVKKGVIEILGSLGNPVALNIITNSIVDPELVDCVAAELVQAGESSVEPLIALIRSDQHYTRQKAGEILGKIGEPAVIPLITELTNNSLSVRRTVIEALGRIKDSRAVQPLIRELAAAHPEGSQRERGPTRKDGKGSEYLGRQIREKYLRSPSIIQRLIVSDFTESLAGAAEDEKELYWAVVEALYGIGEPAVKPLIESLSADNPRFWDSASLILMLIGKDAVEPLIGALADENPKIHNWAIEILVGIGDAAREQLQNAVADEEPRIWVGATKALYRLESKDSEDEEQSEDPHIIIVGPEKDAHIRIVQPRIDPPVTKLDFSGLSNIFQPPDRYGPQIKLALGRGLSAIKDKDSKKRLVAARFFAQTVEIYKDEVGKLTKNESITLFESYFADLLTTAMGALSSALLDKDLNVRTEVATLLRSSDDTASYYLNRLRGLHLGDISFMEDYIKQFITEEAERRKFMEAANQVIARIEVLYSQFQKEI